MRVLCHCLQIGKVIIGFVVVDMVNLPAVGYAVAIIISVSVNANPCCMEIAKFFIAAKSYSVKSLVIFINLLNFGRIR